MIKIKEFSDVWTASPDDFPPLITIEVDADESETKWVAEAYFVFIKRWDR